MHQYSSQHGVMGADSKAFKCKSMASLAQNNIISEGSMRAAGDRGKTCPT